MDRAAVELVTDIFRTTPGNHLDVPAGEPMYDAPLVGVADAADPWFERLTGETIGPFHFTPRQALTFAAPGATARSVISYFLPIAACARRANAAETVAAAREWGYVRTFGEHLNVAVREGLSAALRKEGHAAVSPQELPQNTVARRPGVGLSSCWSERHVAFIAGLGTFGISGGLITRRGIAGRFGSVVTDAVFEPTPREYGDAPFAWCLAMSEGTCGVCRSRCPAGSIGATVQERNKEACCAYVDQQTRRLRGTRYTWEGTVGCGLCQTRIPCESNRPSPRVL